MRKFMQCLIFGCILSIISLFTAFFTANQHDFWLMMRTGIPKIDDNLETNNIKHMVQGRRIILLWTTYFGDPTWESHGLLTNACPYQNCVITHDRKMLREADILLFHCRDEVEYWPEYRTPNQIYVLFCHESPEYTSFDEYNYHINLTATYRRDSDLYVPYTGLDKIMNKPSSELKYESKIPFKGKNHTIVWPVSHCSTKSRRETYVRELSRFIDVDIYGECGTSKCQPPGSSDCMSQFEKEYKFYLSLENSICDGYITEKLYRPLQREIIPIVLGGGDYGTIAPTHSVINIQDFESPQHLADYLHHLSQNETEYNRYFQWKPGYVFEGAKWDLFCQLCKLLNDGYYEKQVWNISKWWSEGTCNETVVPLLLAYKHSGSALLHGLLGSSFVGFIAVIGLIVLFRRKEKHLQTHNFNATSESL